MGLSHTQLIQSEQFQQSNYTRGNYLIEQNFHLSENNTSELEQNFRYSPLITLNQTKLKYPDLKIQTFSLDFLQININFTTK